MRAAPSLCEGCGGPEARLRRCTRQRLCALCRARPEHKILTGAEVRRATGLEERDFLFLRAGSVVNPRSAGFPRLGVYFWKDVAELCVSRGLDIP
jgi:hypothetical protein